MARCNKCGQRIDWVRTAAGKSMPADPGEYAIVADRYGAVSAVWPDGHTAKGKVVSENTESGYEYCRISHFSTCKGVR